MKNLNWKNILIIWIAIGVLAIGLFHIFAPSGYFESRSHGIFSQGFRTNYLGRNLSLLITIVGAILIWGLKIYKKEIK